MAKRPRTVFPITRVGVKVLERIGTETFETEVVRIIKDKKGKVKYVETRCGFEYDALTGAALMKTSTYNAIRSPDYKDIR